MDLLPFGSKGSAAGRFGAAGRAALASHAGIYRVRGWRVTSDLSRNLKPAADAGESTLPAPPHRIEYAPRGALPRWFAARKP